MHCARCTYYGRTIVRGDIMTSQKRESMKPLMEILKPDNLWQFTAYITPENDSTIESVLGGDDPNYLSDVCSELSKFAADISITDAGLATLTKALVESAANCEWHEHVGYVLHNNKRVSAHQKNPKLTCVDFECIKNGKKFMLSVRVFNGKITQSDTCWLLRARPNGN